MALPVLALSSCGGDAGGPAPEDTPAIASLTVSPPSLRLIVGQSGALVAVIKDRAGHVLADRAVSWVAASEDIASVSATGVVRGVAPGITTVTAAAGGQSGAASITVVQVPVATITLDLTALSLGVGQSRQLVATPKDSVGNVLDGRSITWSSNDTIVATVSATGVVAAKTPGTALIRVASEGVSATATVTVTQPAPVVSLDFTRELLGTPPTLSPRLQSLDVATGTAVINGVDARAPSLPFTFNWGDGAATTGFFPQTHVYTATTRNYLVRVTAHYSVSMADSVDLIVHFVPAQIDARPFPTAVTVSIPPVAPALTSRQPGYNPPAQLQAFSDAFFSPALPRANVEYILSQAAAIEASALEYDIERVNGEWRQVVLHDPNAGGAYSLWFTTPISFGAAASFFQGTPGYSSLFHEMGHNLSLNAPAAFRYGGHIDGNANAIFSEAVAQMFQHAAAFELVNNAANHGIPADLALDIANSARQSAQVVRGFYDTYVAQGMPFATWNDPTTPVDETIGSFMTVARQFMVHADQSGDHIGPLTRTMRLLRSFNATLAAQYAPQQNSNAASTFRSTLMVAAISYGFQQDLRTEFRLLNFPVDDAIYSMLIAAVH